ncbi:MAG: mechanosensitive ion channel [Gammaproteobacteria bacterium]|nr:mechanosensitive ion channel [Gammaproteobacteria bacterium]
MRRHIQFFYSALLLLIFSVTYAQENTPNDFDINRAHTQLVTIKLHLKQQASQHADLNKTKEVVSTIKNNAESCIKKNKKNLSQLEALSPTKTTPNAPPTPKKTDDFLAQEKTKTSKNLSDCKLLLYEADKLHTQIEQATNDNQTSYNFLKTVALWKVKDKKNLFVLPHYDLKRLNQLMGLNNIVSSHLIPSLLTRIFLALFSAYLLLRITSHLLKANKHAQELIKPFRIYLPLILTLFLTHLFLVDNLKNIYPPPLINNIIQHLNTFFMTLLFIQLNYAMLAYRKKSQVKQLIQKIIIGSIVLSSILIFSALLHIINPTVIKSTVTPSGYAIIYLLLTSSLFIWIFNTTLQLISKYKYCSHLQTQLVTAFNILLFAGLIILSVSGYNEIALFAAEHIMKTCLLIFMFLEVIYFIWVYAKILKDKTDPLSIRFYQWTGLKSQKNLIEVFILKYLLTINLIHIFFQLFVILWDLPGYYLNKTLDYFQNGMYIFTMQINMLAIFRGLIAFCFIIILGRLLGAFFSSRNKSADQKKTGIIVITLTNYVAFIFATLIALMVMGINLSGFALVASALSVGIGFGLKGIASDLISGLILLLSKPLRPGDHIEVKEIEGFISSIRLLSTEIKTLSEANVIIPNSALLSQSVTNYTYKNKYTRITTYIMLKDAADVKRAKKIMLNVAKKHPEIHQEARKKPELIVDLRPDKSAMHIVLTLWCIIKDADERYRINSDVNAKVLDAIEKAGIPLKL